MSIARFRPTPESRAHQHPKGEFVWYGDHAKEVARLRELITKQAEQARRWKGLAEREGTTP